MSVINPAELPWATIIGVITIIGTTWVGFYTARSARSANRETSQLTSWREMVTELRTDVSRLRSERVEDEKRYQSELDECNARLDTLATRVAESERRERALILWARKVITLMESAEFQFPAPPVNVHDTNPGMRRVT